MDPARKAIRLGEFGVLPTPDAVAMIHPRLFSPERSGRFDLLRQMGFYQRNLSIGSEHANQDYEQARPFGEFEVKSVDQSYRNERPGTLAVHAFGQRWPEAPAARLNNAKTVSQWRWNVPDDLRDTFSNWSEMVYRDRYFSLALTWPVYRRNPALLGFDLQKGLHWQAQVLVAQALQEYARRTRVAVDLHSPTPSGDGGGWVFTERTQDGARTLLSIAWAKPGLTLLFVYDGDGTLRRTLVLPRATVLEIRRAPSAPLFTLRLSLDNQGLYTWLINADGVPLGRFVDDQNRPIHPGMLADAHAWAEYRERVGGTPAAPGSAAQEIRRELLWDLPAL